MVEKYYQVRQVAEAVQLLDELKGKAKIVAGATDLWLEIKNGGHKGLESLIDISRIQGLDQITLDEKGNVHIHALATHAHCVKSEILKKYAACLYQACRSVGSPQIRNRGTVAGNVVTSSPANDTISALMALDATLVAVSAGGTRQIPIVEFFTGVRKNVLKPDELITEIVFRGLDPDNSFSFFTKQGLRKAQAISVLNLSVVCQLDPAGKIGDMRIAFGSLAPTVVRARQAEEYARGKTLQQLDLEELTKRAVESISPIDDIRSTSSYRHKMAAILLKRGLTAKMAHPEAESLEGERAVTLWGKQKSTYSPLAQKFIDDPNSAIHFQVNGKACMAKYHPGQSLLDIIRDQAGLTGSKEGCGEGECGACTVFMDGVAVLACLIPSARAQNARIETIEYLSQGQGISRLQECFIQENAVQCGYCTPGFLMSATKLLEEISDPTLDEIKTAISGNLCRCTGYYKIVNAIQKAAESS
jgi:carbon-monoxide dehydrogenase medium subunit